MEDKLIIEAIKELTALAALVIEKKECILMYGDSKAAVLSSESPSHEWWRVQRIKAKELQVSTKSNAV